MGRARMAAAKKKSVRRTGKSAGVGKTTAAAESPLTSALAQASWIEADAALAEALVDLDDLEQAAPARRAELLDLIRQALSRAARKRGLTRFGAVGASETFDPERHDLTSAGARAPKSVEVVARGVARAGEVLAKARVRKP